MFDELEKYKHPTNSFICQPTTWIRFAMRRTIRVVFLSFTPGKAED